MDFKALQKKYQQLLIENNSLKEEIKMLKIQPGLTAGREESHESSDAVSVQAPEPELFGKQIETEPSASAEAINKRSDPDEKVRLFMSLFRGRDDVYAKRWENKAKETAGYAPACGNEWNPGICHKPKIKCPACKHQDFLPLHETAVDAHLRGRENLVAGIYPLLPNETCWFLAIDFDDEGWQKDVTTLREVCSFFEIPVVIERSRSGNGAHAWFFFNQAVTACACRPLINQELYLVQMKQPNTCAYRGDVKRI